MEKKTNLSLKPQRIDANTWYYENPGGIEVIHYPRRAKECLTIKISWRKLRASLKRKNS